VVFNPHRKANIMYFDGKNWIVIMASFDQCLNAEKPASDKQFSLSSYDMTLALFKFLIDIYFVSVLGYVS
jgi:hypothetical protein